MRVTWVLLVPTEPAVDFASYHSFAEGLASGASIDLLLLRLRLQEIGYPLFLAGAYELFGATPVVGRALNVLLALWLFVVIGRLLARSGEEVTRTGLMLTALWPGHIAMSSLLASENLFLPLLWTGGALMVRGQFVAGLVLGLAQAVRPPALMMIAVVCWVTRRRWREALMVLAGVSLSFGAYRASLFASGDSASRGGAPYSLLMGANQSSGGAWNFADHQSFDLDRALHGASEANSAALSKSLQRLAAAPLDMLVLMARKFRAQWGNAAAPFSFAMAAPATSWLALADAWALLVWLLALSRVRCKVEPPAVELLALAALVGTCASHLLLEANPRYALPWVQGVVLLAAAAPRFTRTP